jgi:hypothetical protein
MNKPGRKAAAHAAAAQAAQPSAAEHTGDSQALHPLLWHRSVIDVHLVAERFRREMAPPDARQAMLQVLVLYSSYW